MAQLPADVRDAHVHCNLNRSALEQSTICGCFYCCRVYSPEAIDEWVDELSGGQTALCPGCGIDSVIADRSGYPITEEFMQKMNSYWF